MIRGAREGKGGREGTEERREGGDRSQGRAIRQRDDRMGTRGARNRVVKFLGILNLEIFHGNFGNLWEFLGTLGIFRMPQRVLKKKWKIKANPVRN